jgi:hypothetical protein
MNTNVANLSQADIRDISDYFASKPLPPRNQTLDPAKIAAGEKIVGRNEVCGLPTCRLSTVQALCPGLRHRSSRTSSGNWKPSAAVVAVIRWELPS